MPIKAIGAQQDGPCPGGVGSAVIEPGTIDALAGPTQEAWDANTHGSLRGEGMALEGLIAH